MTLNATLVTIFKWEIVCMGNDDTGLLVKKILFTSVRAEIEHILNRSLRFLCI